MYKRQLQGIIRQLADKQEKLQTADRQLIELKKDMGAIEERTEELKEDCLLYTSFPDNGSNEAFEIVFFVKPGLEEYLELTDEGYRWKA